MSRWAATFLLVALASGPVSAQGPPAPPVLIPRDGTEIFRWLFHRAEIKPLTEQEFLANFDRNRPRHVEREHDLIVVILGEIHGTALHPNPMVYAKWATSQGGAALIATDSPVNFTQTFGKFGINVPPPVEVDGRIVLGGDPNDCYRGRPECPYVVPFTPPMRATEPEWELFGGLSRVATNTASYISLDARAKLAEFRHPLAGYPTGSTIQQPGARKRVAQNQVFAVGGSGPHPENGAGDGFRFLALADPSVFINGMMVPGDPQWPTDNLRFASRVVSYLVEENEPVPRRRTRCLFIQNGQIVNSFDDLNRYLRPPTPIPTINEEQIVDFIEKGIDQTEKNDTLTTKVLGNTPELQSQRLRAALKVLLIVAAVWASCYVLYRVWRACQPLNHPPPPPAGRPTGPAGHPSVEGVFDRRERELLRRNNLYEPVRSVIQELFAAAGAPVGSSRRLPAIEMSDAVRRSGTLRRALLDLWDVAHGPPQVVTVQRWKVLEPLFVRVQQAHADGKWWFRHAGPKSSPGIGQGNGA